MFRSAAAITFAAASLPLAMWPHSSMAGGYILTDQTTLILKDEPVDVRREFTAINSSFQQCSTREEKCPIEITATVQFANNKTPNVYAGIGVKVRNQTPECIWYGVLPTDGSTVGWTAILIEQLDPGPGETVTIGVCRDPKSAAHPFQVTKYRAVLRTYIGVNTPQ